MADLTKTKQNATSTTNTANTATTKPKQKTGFLAGLSARIARISQFLSPQVDDGTSTFELMDQLYELLRATEPGFEYIDAVYPDVKSVVFCCYLNKNWKDFRRTYSVDASGNVTLNDDRVEVVRRTVWEPVESGETLTVSPASACSCGGVVSNVNADNENVTNNEEEAMGNETVNGVNGNANTNETATPPAASAAPVTAPTPNATSPVTTPNTADTNANVNTNANTNANATPPIDRAALLATLGITENDILAIRSHGAAQTDRKQVLVSALAEAQDRFTVDQLNAMDTATLEGIADLVAPSLGINLNSNANTNAQNLIVGDFRGARPRSVANTREPYTPPDPLGVNAMLYGGTAKNEKK